MWVRPRKVLKLYLCVCLWDGSDTITKMFSPHVPKSFKDTHLLIFEGFLKDLKMVKQFNSIGVVVNGSPGE